MASNLIQMLDAIETQLLLSSEVTDPNNVFCGELPAKSGSPDSLFPRLEYLMHEENNFEYINNKGDLQPVHWFSVSGYIRVPVEQDINDDTTAAVAKARMVRVMEFMRETMTNLFKLNDLKLGGTLGIDGFIQMHSLYHAVCYHEVLPCMDSFVFNLGIEATRPYNRE